MGLCGYSSARSGPLGVAGDSTDHVRNIEIRLYDFIAGLNIAMSVSTSSRSPNFVTSGVYISLTPYGLIGVSVKTHFMKERHVRGGPKSVSGEPPYRPESGIYSCSRFDSTKCIIVCL